MHILVLSCNRELDEWTAVPIFRWFLEEENELTNETDALHPTSELHRLVQRSLDVVPRGDKLDAECLRKVQNLRTNNEVTVHGICNKILETR